MRRKKQDEVGCTLPLKDSKQRRAIGEKVTLRFIPQRIGFNDGMGGSN